MTDQRRGLVVAALMLTTGLAAIDATIVATAVPQIVHDLGGPADAHSQRRNYDRVTPK